MNDDRKSNTEQPAESSDSKTEDDASQRRRSLRKLLLGAGALFLQQMPDSGGTWRPGLPDEPEDIVLEPTSHRELSSSGPLSPRTAPTELGGESDEPDDDE